MSGEPYSADDIERVLGPTWRKRAEAKRRGGDAAGVGYRFELSVALELLIQASARARRGRIAVSFHDQPLGFADDLLVVRERVYEFYQIKSELSVPSMPRRRLVVGDLCLQVDLMMALGHKACVSLVVADTAIRHAYEAAIPERLFNIFQRPRDPLPQAAARNKLVVRAAHDLIGGTELTSSLVDDQFVHLLCRAFHSAWEDCERSGSLVSIMDVAAASCHWMFGSGGLNLSEASSAVLDEVDGVEIAAVGRCLVAHELATGYRRIMQFRDQHHFDAFVGALSKARRQLSLGLILLAKARLDGI